MAKVLIFAICLYGAEKNIYNSKKSQKEADGRMNGLLPRLRNAAARFLYGRNGADALCRAMFALSAAVYLAALLVRGAVPRLTLSLLSAALGALVLWRVFSRDLVRRRAENARYLALTGGVRSAVSGFLQRARDKDHKYVRCVCGTWCRVPRNVGRVELMCPKCGEKIRLDTNK